MDDVINAFALLRRPPIVIFAISAFAILAGFTFALRPDVGTSGAFQDATGYILIAAGVIGVALIGIPNHRRNIARVALSISGSVIVVGFGMRGASLWQALAFNELGSAWSYYLVGGAQWLALAYMTMVAWFDVALPWVLARSR